MKKISYYLFILLLILSCSASVSAETITKVYPLQEEKESQVVPKGDYYRKNLLSVHPRISPPRGKLILSSTADGSGNIEVDDVLTIARSTPRMHNVYQIFINRDFNSGTIPPVDISFMLLESYIYDYNDLTVAVNADHTSDIPKYYGPLYLVHIYEERPIEPFLILPWDYKSKGLSFVDAALSMTSYFDHEYPLLSVSTSFPEQPSFSNTIMLYDGSIHTSGFIPGTTAYTSHDGYDYARKGGANQGDPVLAAAAGTATFHNNCRSCGNAIHINHNNGYQTRYYHLMNEGLITKFTNSPVAVTQGQQIGKVGWTGNVKPKGESGAHIHFMVIRDKNNDGSFDDNIPDGLIDPYGWQSENEDPWEEFSFEYNGSRTGSKSHYLWTNKGINNTIVLNDEAQIVLAGRYKLDFAKNSFDDTLILDTKLLPIHDKKIEGNKVPLLYILDAKLRDIYNNAHTTVKKLFNLSFDLKNIDTTRYKAETLAIYSSNDDGQTWEKQNTTLASNLASTQLNHFTHFALAGEPLDSIPPVTIASLSGTLIDDNTYLKPVSVILEATDEPQLATLGISSTQYKLVKNDAEPIDWTIYDESFEVSESAKYKLFYYSIDGDNNTEEVKSLEFELLDEAPLEPTPTLTPSSTPTNTPTPTPTQAPPQSFSLSLQKDNFDFDIQFGDYLRSVQQIQKKNGKLTNQFIYTYSSESATVSPTLLLVKTGNTDRVTYSLKQIVNSKGNTIVLEKNALSYRNVYDKKTGELIKRKESFIIKNQLNVRAVYIPKKNTTRFIVKQADGSVETTVLEGEKHFTVQLDQEGKFTYQLVE